MEPSFVRLFGKNANIKPDRLEFLDKNFKRFRNAGFGDILPLHDSFIGFDAPYNVIRFNGKNFLKSIGCAVSFESPNLHFAETLAAELRFTTERLLSYERVRPGGASVYFVVNEVMKFEHINTADGNAIFKWFASAAVVEYRFTVRV